jgi:hypothetical protein
VAERWLNVSNQRIVLCDRLKEALPARSVSHLNLMSVLRQRMPIVDLSNSQAVIENVSAVFR